MRKKHEIIGSQYNRTPAHKRKNQNYKNIEDTTQQTKIRREKTRQQLIQKQPPSEEVIQVINQSSKPRKRVG